MIVKFKYIQLLISLFLFLSCGKEKTKVIDLSGKWHFQIDSLDRGVSEKWYDEDLSDTISLPGSMAENAKGNDISVNTNWTGSMWNDSAWYKSPKYEKYRQPGNIKASFWLSPDKVYTGPAWYQKRVDVPEDWKVKAIGLHLERAHWETTLWVDGNKVGMKNTLGTPHDYNLAEYLSPGEHTVTLRIDNRIKDIDPGVDAHGSKIMEMDIDSVGKFEVDYFMGENPLLWDEFDPNLYTMQLSLKSKKGIHEKDVVFGMRDFKAKGKQFAINGRPVFLRGTLEYAIFP